MKTYILVLTIGLLSLADISFGQEAFLRGKVIDQQTNQPIIYSTVELKALKTGAYTDSIGNFSIKFNDSKDTLEFNSL